jgi:DNA-binding XRE family transcriptional regulator
MDKAQLIELIEYRRIVAGLRVTQAARAAGVNQATWQRMSKGDIQPSWEMLFTIAASLGLGVGVVCHDC